MPYNLEEFKQWVAEDESRKENLEWDVVFCSELVFKRLVGGFFALDIVDYFARDNYLFDKYKEVVKKWKSELKESESEGEQSKRNPFRLSRKEESLGKRLIEKRDNELTAPFKQEIAELKQRIIELETDSSKWNKRNPYSQTKRTSKQPTTFLREEIKLSESLEKTKQQLTQTEEELTECKQELTELEEDDKTNREIISDLEAQSKQQTQTLTDLQTQLTEKEQTLAQKTAEITQKFAQLTTKLATTEQQTQLITNLEAKITNLKTHHSAQLITLKEQAQQTIERVVRDKELEIEDLLTKLTTLKQRLTKEDNWLTNLKNHPPTNYLLILLGVIIVGYLVMK